MLKNVENLENNNIKNKIKEIVEDVLKSVLSVILYIKIRNLKIHLKRNNSMRIPLNQP
jgi:hypothetical protein